MLFLITIFLNLSLYSNFLILTGDLSFIAFVSGAILSGEKQMAFITCFSVCSWQVTYFDDSVFLVAVSPCTQHESSSPMYKAICEITVYVPIIEFYNIISTI